jgi:hypothetical protein
MESTRESKRSGAAEDDGFIEVGHDNARHGQAFTPSLSSALALGALYITSLQTHGLPHAVLLPFSFLTVLKCVFLCFYFHHPLGLLCCFSHVLKPRNAMRAAKEQSSKETSWASRLLHRLLLKTRPWGVELIYYSGPIFTALHPSCLRHVTGTRVADKVESEPCSSAHRNQSCRPQLK